MMITTRKPSARRPLPPFAALLGACSSVAFAAAIAARPAAAQPAAAEPSAAAGGPLAWLIFAAGLLIGLSAAWWLQERRRLRETADLRAKLGATEARMAALQDAFEHKSRAKDEELDQFIYRVSHDLRSPLTTILAFGSMLEEDLRDGETEAVSEGLAHIDSAAAKLARMLEDLLKLSRSGRALSDPRPVDLSDALRRAEESLAERLEARGARVELVSELPAVVGDAVRLQQIFECLIDNAVKFMGEQASPRVEIGCLDEQGGDDGPTIYVRDNGAGIEAADLERVFGLYERLHGDVDGMGVGLAIVRRIVECHGGAIWIESAGAARGTTVLFRLAAATSGESN